MSTNPIKIVLADDHQLFLDGVEQILSTSESFSVLAKVDNGKLLIQTLNRIRPDLILLDINMPYMTGMEAARIIRSSLPDIKLVFLSMYYDAKIISLARQQGVNGFILKNTTANELRETLVRVMEGETVFVSIKDTAHAETAEDAFTKRFKLSPRELEIIQLIKQGKSTKEIADLLTLSFFTVETHRKNIFRKLDVVNVGQLVSFAKDNNF